MKSWRVHRCLVLLAGVIAAGCSHRDHLPPGVSVLPYVETLASNAVVVSWHTAASFSGALEWRTASQTTLFPSVVSQSFHRVVMSNLPPGSVSQYRLAGLNLPWCTVRTFSPDRTAYSFIAFGDNRKFVRIFEHVVNVITQHPADFAVHTGDCVTKGTVLSQWEREWFSPARPMLGQYPVLISWGNHEEPWKTNSGVHRYYPSISPLRGKAYYSFQQGPVLFAVLNLYESVTTQSAQYLWLDNLLASNTLPYIIVISHPSPMTGSEHALDADTESLRKFLVPLFVRYRVTACISGHDHLYARGAYGGVKFITSAGSGAPFHKMDRFLHPFTLFQTSCYHYVVMEVSEAAISGTAYTLDNTIVDRFTLSPASGPPPPLIEAVPTFEPPAAYPGFGPFDSEITMSSFVGHPVTGTVSVAVNADWTVEPSNTFEFIVPSRSQLHTIKVRATPAKAAAGVCPLSVTVCIGTTTNTMTCPITHIPRGR